MPPIRRLPDTELEVMQALWDCDAPASRAQLEEVLYKTHPMALTTLLTLLSRLAEKGFVRIEKQGRASCYTSLVSRPDYLASQSKSLFEKLFGGSMPAFAAALCDSGISEEDLKELRELLERREL